MRILICCLLLMGCARSEIKEAADAMRPVSSPPQILDEYNSRSLVKALIENVKHLKKKPQKMMVFGPKSISQGEYAQHLEKFITAFTSFQTKNDLSIYIDKNFEVFEIYGKKKWGEVFITSYFEPVIPGSVYRTKKYAQPIYATPEDMVIIDVGEFADVFPKWKVFADEVLEQRSSKPIFRGRLMKNGGKFARIHPYFSREDIDSKKLLKNSKLIMAWVDPIDAFFLQIQGSGVVKLKDGRKIRVGYDSQNGHPYVPIGKFLYDTIPPEKMSLQAIEKHMRSLSKEEQQKLMNENPSYVFFRKIKKRGLTYFGTPVVDGRTVATDYHYFPKGSLAFLKFPKPSLNDDNEIIGQKEHSRLVIDQDTGGAIRGPHRLDLFWGRGEEAKKYAGVMKHWGELYYLFPKNREEVHGKESTHGSQANSQSTLR